VITIRCDSCKCELHLQEKAAMRMAVQVDAENHVIPCPNPTCNSNIQVRIEGEMEKCLNSKV